MTVRMSWAQVSARRMLRHHLGDPAATIADVARDIAGVHAQVMSAAELSIGQRVEGITRIDVRDALWTDRTLVKTRGPRGTVHLLAAADLPIWVGALSAMPVANPMPAKLRMTADETDRVVGAIADALAEAELTVDELTEAIVARVGSWAGDRVMPAFQDAWPRWRQVEVVAANRGAMCFGPERNRRATYTSPGRWLPGFCPAPADEALAALVRRYLHAYGPSTSAHFARWLGGSPAWAGRVFPALELQQVDVEGEAAWVTAGDTQAPETGYEGVRLLPYFDAFVVGCHPRDRLFPGQAWQRALAGGQAGNFPVLLIDGVVAGVWHQRRSGRKIAMTVEPLAPLGARHRRLLDDEAHRVGRVLQGSVELTIGAVTVGGHA